eukprot:c21423_g2_i1.p1 GENE.c21423_g2_i1~~c21423_g2_i1.p1  ORF type:complete len:259 (+),score=120.80 c21423_g2_i1:513-1289(+)
MNIQCAATMAGMGFTVKLIIESTSIIESCLSSELSKIYENFLKHKGIIILKGQACTNILTKDGKVVGCQIAHDEIIHGEIVVVNVGTQPNVYLWQGKILLQENVLRPGISVDSCLRTNISGVYAVGGVACLPFFMCEQSQLEHYPLAAQTTDHLANILLGLPSQLQCDPFHSCSLFDISWHFWGEPTGSQHVIFGDVKSKLVALWLWEGRILGAFIQGGNETEKQLLHQAAHTEKLVNLKLLKVVSTPEQLFELLLCC